MIQMDNNKYEELAAKIEQLENIVSGLLLNNSEEQQNTEATEEEIELYYPNVEAWVREEFSQIYARPVGGDFRWCVKWWEHTEAMLRFEALWRAWERMRLDPAFGMAHWYRDYFDISLNIIVGPRGPFSRCSPERHEPIKPLPLVQAPEGYWEPQTIAQDYPRFDFAFNSKNK